MQDLARRLQQASSFVSCLTAQDVRDEQARLLGGRVDQLYATFTASLTEVDRLLLRVPEETWRSLLAHPALAPVAFALDERRRRAGERLPPEQEALVADLAVDGYHAWNDLYELVVGRITVPVEEEGRTVQLSVGQAANRLQSPDRRVRAAVFARWEEAWAREAELCAAALNHLAGFRLNLYRRRGWASVLHEPLDVNRISAETLAAMWEAVEGGKERLVAYLARKAALLGLERLAWYDLEAPLARSARRIPFDEGADFVIEQFGRFSPDLAAFARRALTERWVEAEDRPGKQPGGFCTGFPLHQQSRIFMTYSGTPGNVTTLAHELGHAYHSWVLRDLPPLARQYPMNLAETASTFAELIVADAALRHAASAEERLAMLEEKAQRAVTFLMNIHARFLFETAFYEARREGPLGVAALNQLMVEAQRRAYRDALAVWHPYFWASKLHFYITRVPFYNFPYTFGYLFSLGVYGRAQAEGPRFAQRYVELLRDTGRLRVEELAARHLGVDLTRPDFWREAVALALADVEAFLAHTGEAAGSQAGGAA